MKKLLLTTCLLALTLQATAEDTIELDTTTIKGNTELPKYLYVVPWADKEAKLDKDRKVRLHNLNGDLFDPVMPVRKEESVDPLERIETNETLDQ